MEKTFKEDLRIITITATFFILSVLGVWFLWEDVILLTAVLYFLAFVELSAIGSKKMVILFFLCGVGAVIFESIAISLGAWHYAKPTFFNIPLWLIPGWGNAGVFIVNFYKLLGKIDWLNKK